VPRPVAIAAENPHRECAGLPMAVRSRSPSVGSLHDECDHPEIEISADSPCEDLDAATAPYGPIVQRGRCCACGSELERHLRVNGWAHWRPPGL
jgi:hypothetical protein